MGTYDAIYTRGIRNLGEGLRNVCLSGAYFQIWWYRQKLVVRKYKISNRQ